MQNAPPMAFAPDQEASAFAEFLLNSDDLHDQLLAETSAAAAEGHLVESGRTICTRGGRQTGYDVHQPLARHARSVELARCRSGKTGIMHTHVTQSQLQRASHSLPDFANVVFGNVAASCVVGFEHSQVVVEPDDPAAAQEAFREAIGVSVQSPADVVRALERGQIPDPADARANVEDRLAALIRTRATPNPEWRDELLSPLIPRSNISAAPVDSPATCSHGVAGPHARSHLPAPGAEPDVGRMREQTRELRELLHETTKGVSLRELTVHSLTTTVLSAVIDVLLEE